MEKYVPHNIGKRILLASLSFLPLRTLTKWQSWAMTADKHITDYYVDWGSVAGYKRATRPKRFFNEIEKIPFENTYIYASKVRFEILEFGFGKDYMVPPPPEKWRVHDVHRINNTEIVLEKIMRDVYGKLPE